MKRMFWVMLALILIAVVVAAMAIPARAEGPDKQLEKELSAAVDAAISEQSSERSRVVVLDYYVMFHEAGVDDTIPYEVVDKKSNVIDEGSFRVKDGSGSRSLAVLANAAAIYTLQSFSYKEGNTFIFYIGSARLPPLPKTPWGIVYEIFWPPHVKFEARRLVLPPR